jgi:hypothetical protein
MNEHDKWLESPYAAAEIDHERLQAEISAQADALLAEWAVKSKAEESADGYELLIDDRGDIVHIAAFALAQIGQDVLACRVTERDAAVLVGNAVIRMVKACAVQVATHTLTEAA